MTPQERGRDRRGGALPRPGLSQRPTRLSHRGPRRADVVDDDHPTPHVTCHHGALQVRPARGRIEPGLVLEATNVPDGPVHPHLDALATQPTGGLGGDQLDRVVPPASHGGRCRGHRYQRHGTTPVVGNSACEKRGQLTRRLPRPTFLVRRDEVTQHPLVHPAGDGRGETLDTSGHLEGWVTSERAAARRAQSPPGMLASRAGRAEHQVGGHVQPCRHTMTMCRTDPRASGSLRPVDDDCCLWISPGTRASRACR